jgi:hypothetical protein
MMALFSILGRLMNQRPVSSGSSVAPGQRGLTGISAEQLDADAQKKKLLRAAPRGIMGALFGAKQRSGL